MSVLIDSYSEDNFTGNKFLSASGHSQRAGQTFEGDGKVLTSVKFYTRKYGSPTGDCYAKIYNITGTYGIDAIPTGNALATSEGIDTAGLSTTQSLVEFTFSGANQITLADGTKYAVMLEYTSGGDSANYIYFGGDSLSPAHPGNMVIGSTAFSGLDGIFYVYGESPTTPTVGVKYPLPPFKRGGSGGTSPFEP